MAGTRFHLTFPERLEREPVMFRLGERFGVITTIRRANVEERTAWMIVDLDGSADSVDEAVAWLKEQGVEVAPVEGGA